MIRYFIKGRTAMLSEKALQKHNYFIETTHAQLTKLDGEGEICVMSDPRPRTTRSKPCVAELADEAALTRHDFDDGTEATRWQRREKR